MMADSRRERCSGCAPCGLGAPCTRPLIGTAITAPCSWRTGYSRRAPGSRGLCKTRRTMSPSRSAPQSEFLRVRGLRYHVRRWGDPDAPQVFLLHGFMDVSATRQPVAEGLLPKFQVLCPDFRGFGNTEW